MTETKQPDITLVDIVHDDNATTLTSPVMEKILFEKVLLGIDSNTRICVEGINTGIKGLMPLDDNYPLVVNKLWPTYAQSIPEITLYGADPRCRVGFEQNKKLMLEIDALLTVLVAKH